LIHGWPPSNAFSHRSTLAQCKAAVGAIHAINAATNGSLLASRAVVLPSRANLAKCIRNRVIHLDFHSSHDDQGRALSDVRACAGEKPDCADSGSGFARSLRPRRQLVRARSVISRITMYSMPDISSHNPTTTRPRVDGGGGNVAICHARRCSAAPASYTKASSRHQHQGHKPDNPSPKKRRAPAFPEKPGATTPGTNRTLNAG
jgi:hypothetical protein